MSLTKPHHVALSIRGREIKYEYRIVDIDKVRFYRKNPRIATILAEHIGDVTDDTIDKILWERNETHRLHRQIQKDGGLIHPVLVYQDKVLEGNTRLCCYRHLYESTKSDIWKTIKCHVIIDELTQDEIYRLLCTEHIEGKIEWEAYEKANLYSEMKDEEGLTLQQISELVGESTATVGYRIRAYQMMVENRVVNKTKYSHFEQLARNPDIPKIKRSDPDIENKVIGLIKDEKIPKAQDVRKLGDIYKHKKARKRLLEDKENIDQVYHDLKAKAPMTDSPFMKDIEELLKKLKKLTREDRDGLKKSKRDCIKISHLFKELVKLCKELEITVNLPRKIRKS